MFSLELIGEILGVASGTSMKSKGVWNTLLRGKIWLFYILESRIHIKYMSMERRQVLTSPVASFAHVKVTTTSATQDSSWSWAFSKMNKFVLLGSQKLSAQECKILQGYAAYVPPPNRRSIFMILYIHIF